MITWGLVSGAMAFASGTASFLTLRFLLGVAEAGVLSQGSSSISLTGSPSPTGRA